MIDGVIITPLKKIPDERGIIMHMLRNDDTQFTKFGEIYFSIIYPEAIKAWHLHTKMTLQYAVPQGEIKLVLYDDRKNSKTNGEIMEIFTGESNYVRITIPKGVWNGYKGIGVKPALVANCPDMPHDPEEMKRAEPIQGPIPYNWDIVHK